MEGDIPHLPAQQAGAVYRQFLAQLRQLTHAAGVSLYIDGGGNLERSLLLHGGGTEAVPEFESLERAHATTYAMLGPGGGSGAPALQVYSSEADDSCLVRVSIRLDFDEAEVTAERRHTPEPEADRAIWIGLRYDAGHVPEEISSLAPPRAQAPETAADWLAHSLLTSANMVWEANQLSQLLRDPTSHLPGRAEFQAHLSDAMENARGHHPLGLLLINPDDFDLVNRRLDRDSGDAALAEIATRLCDSLRHSDEVFRYGGAVFAVQMPGASRKKTQEVAEKLREAITGAYLEGVMRLTFSIGIGLYEPDQAEDRDLDELGLVRRADASLNAAKGKGGDCVMVWQSGDESLDPVAHAAMTSVARLLLNLDEAIHKK